jgi:hypothetical protein
MSTTYLIIYDQTKTSAETIQQTASNIDYNIQFKIETEKKNNTFSYLDLEIHRKNNQIDLNIHRKLTHTDIVTNLTLNHPHSQKLAAFHYYINRLNNLPIKKTAKEHEWRQILTMAHNNGFPTHLIQELKN